MFLMSIKKVLAKRQSYRKLLIATALTLSMFGRSNTPAQTFINSNLNKCFKCLFPMDPKPTKFTIIL